MILSKKIKKYVKEWGIRLTAKIFRLASLSYAPIGFRLKCEPTCLSANGFQDFSRNPTLTQNNRKYQTIENAENPVKSRAFGVLLFSKTETVDSARFSASKTISKDFLEKLLDKSAPMCPVASHILSAKSATTD